MIKQRRSETHSMSLHQYDLICLDSKLWHSGALKQLDRNLCITIRFVLLPIDQPFAMQSVMSRQRLLTHLRSAATGTSLCIVIRCVLLLMTIFHYDVVCLATENSFSLRYDLFYWKSAFCITIWFVQTATVFLHYDTIFSAVENSFSVRYDLSRQLRNLSVKWVS